MVNYREILRSTQSWVLSTGGLHHLVHSSRSTVKEVIDLANALKIEWPLDSNVTNTDLEMLLYPDRAEKDFNRMPIDFPWIPQGTCQERGYDDASLDGILRSSLCCR